MSNDELGRFIDRQRFRYEREYPHPPERVWEAITSPEHLDAWFMPYNEIDARPGGAISFSFGNDPSARTMRGTIVEFTPYEVVDYAFEHGGHMRFELRPAAGGTRLSFTQFFPPDFAFNDGMAENEAAGSDLPGGPDTPWRPGMLAGYHVSLETLGSYLNGRGPTRDDMIKRIATGAFRTAQWASLTQRYRALVRETIPAAT